MKKISSLKYLSLLAIIILTALTIGCGGGGGGGGGPVGPGTDFNPTSVVSPDTVPTLSQPAKLYNYRSTAANTALVIPVESSESVRYALTVSNTGPVSQTVGFKPESYVTWVPAASVMADVRASVADDLMVIRTAQTGLEAKLRQDFIDSMRSSSQNLRANRSVRAANNVGEEVGEDRTFYVTGDGSTYIPITCRLAIKGSKCKIFVDKNPYPAVNGYSAVEVTSRGDFRITDEDLEHFVSEFDTKIYPLLTDHYGPAYDIDNDKMLSIVLSPFYAYFNFAGLFNSNDLHPSPKTTGTTQYSNQRDLIALWSPNGTWVGEKWREATRETIAHEMQHIVNMSAKVYPNGVLRDSPPANIDNWLETYWLDESLAVGVEARYRLLRGDPARENRFDRWADNPHAVGMESFSYSFNAFEHYGQKGLFNLYLFEKYGAAKIKSLVQTTTTGKANIENVYGLSIDTLVKNWSIAVMNESLRSQGFTSLSGVDTLHRYTNVLDGPGKKFVIASKNLAFGQAASDLTLAPYATAYYVIQQPAGFSADEYRFRIESTEGQPIEIMMMRLPQ